MVTSRKFYPDWAAIIEVNDDIGFGHFSSVCHGRNVALNNLSKLVG